MAKGTVEAIPRGEIPEDLSEIRWPVLMKTAAALGIVPNQKRPQLEDAVHMALGRVVAVPTLDPVGETGEAGPSGEDDLADMAADYDDLGDVPAFDVGALPDVAMGEAPPADPLSQAPASAQAPEPVAPVAQPVAAKQAKSRSVGWWKDEDGEYPEPPVIYLSRSAKLRIQIASGGEGRTDLEGNFHEPRRAKALQFGPEGGNQLYQCRVDTRDRVKAMETSSKFKTGVVWRARDEADRAIAAAERNLAILKAQASGDRATLAELMAGQPQVLEGARTTRNEPLPEGVGAAYSGPFVGVNAMLNDPGRTGAVMRDGIRHAQARGEPGF